MNYIVHLTYQQSNTLVALCQVIFCDDIASLLKIEALSTLLTALNYGPVAHVLLNEGITGNGDALYPKILQLLLEGSANQQIRFVQLAKELLNRLWFYDRLNTFSQIVQ